MVGKDTDNSENEDIELEEEIQSVPDSRHDRPRGMLSDADRRYLLHGEQKWSVAHTGEAARRRARAIETRIKNGIIDTQLLLRKYHQTDVSLSDVFDSDKVPGENEAMPVPRVQKAMPAALRLLIIGILCDENTSPIKTRNDVAVELQPVIKQFETAVQRWLNTSRNKTARVDIYVNASDIRGIDNYADDLRSRTVTGKERLEAAARLTRAGYDDDEIVEIIGLPPVDE
jgi:hypothetical protein